jgi:hypothetical protein
MDELAKQFAELATKFGPQVSDAAKQAVVTTVYSQLVGSVIPLAISVIFLKAGQWLWEQDDDDGFLKLFACLAWGVTLVSISVFCWQWIDPWTWIALNHPELYLAKRAFGL